MLEYIYIARHGFRSNWIDPTISTSVTGTHRDPPLAAYGLEQAQQLADFLAAPKDGDKALPVPELLVTSPFYRCIQTAAYTSSALKLPLKLEHGIQEWYSPTKPDTGLHPRPGEPEVLMKYFEEGIVDPKYKSTVYASRRGETLQELQDRCDLFVDTFIPRIETEFPEVKTVALFAHAASVIALGRALTGNRTLQVKAGCASTSLYKRKSTSKDPSGPEVGAWDILWDGRADYLPNGLERNWDFDQVVLNKEGHVVDDNGTGLPFSAEDELPTGLAPGMEKYLARSGRSQAAIEPKSNDTLVPEQHVQEDMSSRKSRM